jgi:hypothetical protein
VNLTFIYNIYIYIIIISCLCVYIYLSYTTLLGAYSKRCICVTDLVYRFDGIPTIGSVWLGDLKSTALFTNPATHAIVSVGCVISRPPTGVFVASTSFSDNQREKFCEYSFYLIESIIKKVNEGCLVLVHCLEGRSRSPLLLLLLAIHNGVKYSCVCEFYNKLNAAIQRHQVAAFQDYDVHPSYIQADLHHWKAKPTDMMSDIQRYMGRMLEYAGNRPYKNHTCVHLLKLVTWEGSTSWYEEMKKKIKPVSNLLHCGLASPHNTIYISV